MRWMRLNAKAIASLWRRILGWQSVQDFYGFHADADDLAD